MRISSVIKLLAFLAILSGGGYAAFKQFKGSKAGPGAPGGLPIGVVERRDLLQRVTIAGMVAPLRRAMITAPYSGYVQKLFVKVGDRIKEGDPIVTITQSLNSREPVFPLRAPFTGVVTHIDKTEGEFVKEGDLKSFIVRIDDLSKLFVTANAPEIDRAKIKKGQEAIVKASAIIDRSYKAIITDLALAAMEKDSWARSQVEFPIRAEITDPDGELRPGMSVLMDIIAEKKANVLTLRHEFLHKEEDGYYVLRADGSKQTVKVGMQNEEASEILEGVEEGDKVKQVDFASMSLTG